jgi:DNA (cytosine-5)-methyltransferase 3A
VVVLSLFDGMSGGQQAFERIGITFGGNKNIYFAAEIKKHAIKVTKENYPNTIFIGDVTKIGYSKGVLHTGVGDFKVKIDALIGGSPCQDFTLLKANNAKGTEGDKSQLFYEYLRIYREVNPKYFLLENVRMKKESKQQLDFYMNCEGVDINSNLVSFQNRPRIYWTNIPGVTVPEDRNMNFQYYKETDYKICKEYKVKQTPSRMKMWNNGKGRNNFRSGCDNKTYAKKINCLTRKQDCSPNSGLIEFEDFCRYLTVKECELAQTVKVGYTNCLTKAQAYDVLGDGWTIDVIAHILKGIKEG